MRMMYMNTNLIIRRQFHSSNAVDVLLDFVEEVVPTSNDLALVLVVDKVQLIALPRFSNLETIS